MPKEARFNFIPVSASYKKTIKKATVTINKKKQIFFSNSYITNYGADNKFIKFFVDVNKKTLGWSLSDSVDTFKDLKRKGSRRIKKNVSGVAVLQIKGVLNEMELPNKDYRKLTINVYQDRLFGTIHYVRLY